MFDTLKQFFAEITGGKTPDHFEENDYRLAAAALLMHVTAIDGGTSREERAKLHAVLKRHFALDDDTTEALISDAEQADREAVDLYGFTSLLNRTLDDEGRRRIVEMMWELIYVDGRVNEFEDNVVWRAADLLHVSSQDRLALRRRVAGAAVPGDAD